MEENKRQLFLGILIGVICTCLIGGTAFFIGSRQRDSSGVAIGTGGKEASSSEKENGELLSDTVKDKVSVIRSLIDKYYIEDVDNEKLETGIYRGMIEALDDPYVAYYDSGEIDEVTQSIEGTYSGIGATLTQNTETRAITVVRCSEEGPALEAGLLPGDIIVTVDGTEVTGMDIEQVVERIRGEEGTKVELEIYREGETDYRKIGINRKNIPLPTVGHIMLEDQIGYVQITSFDKVTTKQFQDAYDDLNQQGVSGMIVDLRDNLGGMVDTVCDIARHFVPEGLIVYMEDKYGNRTEFKAEGKDVFGKPLVVLVNENSASASEIFAGAVQDTGVGTVVGTTTFGKGVVQQLIGLQDGTALRLTVSKYYTPNGNDIDHKGIEPDVTEELDEQLRTKAVITVEEDNQLQKAIEVLKEKIEQQGSEE